MNSKDKKLREHMKLAYTVMLRRDEEGDFVARIKEFEGCVADGQDEIEALGNLELVKALWIETALKAGQVIPMPDEDEELPSGKFLTRVPRSLHKSLVDIAEQEGVSLNQLVTVALAEVAGRKAAVPMKAIEVDASSHNHYAASPYGSGQRTSTLRLVYSDGLRFSEREKSALVAESTLEDVLSMQSELPLVSSSARKEA